MEPADGTPWFMDVVFSHKETEGELFDKMDMQLEAIASMCGMEDVFQLEVAFIFDVISVCKGDEAQIH